MEIVTLLIRQNIIMFLYLMIGYLLFRNKLLTSAGSGELGKILLYVIMPVAIVKSYIQTYSTEMLVGFLISFAAAAAALILAMIISTLIFSRRKDAVRQFGAAFSNAGFIGIPLVQMTLGDGAVFYVASFVAILNLLQWTYGVLIMTKDQSAISLKKIRTNPILIAFLIGMCLFFLPIELPAALAGMVSTIASMNGPLAMIVLGAYLAQVPLIELVKDPDTYLCTAVRLLIIPVLTMLLLCLLPGKYQMIRMAVLLAASAPVGSNVAIFAQIYGANYRNAVKDVCLSTLCSIITMPLILAFANLLWTP